MGWERFSYYLFSKKQLLLNIMSPTTKKEAWSIMSLCGYLGVLFGPISQGLQSCLPCMEPRIRYDSNGLASEHSVISRLSVAYQNVYKTHVKS